MIDQPLAAAAPATAGTTAPGTVATGAALVHDVGGGILGEFNRAGVIGPADVHVARRLRALGDPGGPPEVDLAVALAVRAPRAGHVSADLRTVRDVAAIDVGDDVDLDALAWPEVGPWLEAVAASPLVAVEGSPSDGRRPLHLVGSSLYLDRHWRDELAVAAELRGRAALPPPACDAAVLEEGADRLFAGAADSDQRVAALGAVTRGLAVVAGGPGTGKTTTVARILALLHEQAAAAGARPPLVALAAPTGKAAARLEQAVRDEAAGLDTAPAIRARLVATTGSTLHRLLGSRPGRASFRHDRGNRLPHDVVVVDEASMVSLAMMARLLEAVRPDGRVVLVGDPQQLASVEAGAVLADIVAAAAPSAPLHPAVALLRTTHRFGGVLAGLASAVREGDEEAAVGLLGSGDPALTWVPADGEAVPAAVAGEVTAWSTALVAAARSGRAASALEVLGAHRVLCAHRRGPVGVRAANDAIESWLLAAVPDLAGEGGWYTGRPVLVGANDYGLGLFNGDTGVSVAAPGGGVVVAWPTDPGGDAARLISPARLPAVETVFAMTVHKSQGSEYDRVTLLLPPATSRLLSRELLYTALTRARRSLVVAGSEDALRAAVRRPVARASGLTARLT